MTSDSCSRSRASACCSRCSPNSVPRASEIGIDSRVLLFSLAVSIATGLLFGLAPLVHLTARNLGLSLKEGGQRATAGSGRQLLRRLLVVSEIAASVMAVVVCGLLLKSFWKMQQIEPGFNPDGLTTFQIYLPETSYPEASDLTGFFRTAVGRDGGTARCRGRICDERASTEAASQRQ